MQGYCFHSSSLREFDVDASDIFEMFSPGCGVYPLLPTAKIQDYL
jgi:hypothetical protein